MYRLTVLLVVLLIPVLCAQVREDQTADMVFKARYCIHNFEFTEQSEFIVPMVDGKPDYKHGYFDKVKFDIDTSCGFYRVKPIKK